MITEQEESKKQRPRIQTYVLKEQSDLFINMPLEETLKWVAEYAHQMVNEVEMLAPLGAEYAEEIGELLSEETFNRYKGVAISLKYPYENYKTSINQVAPETIIMMEQGFLVQSWTTLGSLLESTLQIFLSIYYRDYMKSTWNVWDKETIVQIKAVLKGDFKKNLELIVQQNKENDQKGLTTAQKKSYIKKSEEILKQKSELLQIKKITLSDLLDFYFSEDIINEQDYSKEDLQKIRDYRNSIHSFQKRKIGTWDELNQYSKLVLMLIVEISYRLPDLPDEIPIVDGYMENRTTMVTKENEWFNYKLMVHGDKGIGKGVKEFVQVDPHK